MCADVRAPLPPPSAGVCRSTVARAGERIRCRRQVLRRTADGEHRRVVHCAMPQTAGRYDAIVVGGRVAGALTAAGLAGRGMSVLVLEARGFPSATLSTHYFRGEGLVGSLARLGLLDSLVTQAPKL